MIINGKELSHFDLIAYWAQRHQVSVLYFDLTTYNNLAADKKATGTAYYEGFVDEYIVDIMKQGIFNTVEYQDEDQATLMGASWFPKLADCPDADHYMKAFVVDTWGDIVWENKPT